MIDWQTIRRYVTQGRELPRGNSDKDFMIAEWNERRQVWVLITRMKHGVSYSVDDDIVRGKHYHVMEPSDVYFDVNKRKERLKYE